MPTVTYARLTSELASVYAPELRQPATLAKIDQVLREMNAVGLRRTSDITPGLVARWMAAHPERKAVTTHALLRSFRAVCSLCVSHRWIASNPFDYRKPSAWIPLGAALESEEDDEPGGKARTADEIRAVLALLDAEAESGEWKPLRLRSLVYTYAFTGMRKHEALRLHRDDVDGVNKTIVIRTRDCTRLKNRRSRRQLVMPEPLADVLRPWLARVGSEWIFPGVTGKRPWTGGPPGHKPLDCIKAAGERAGVHALTIHAFRHTLATLSEEWGWGEMELQRWLGHGSTRTSKYYRHRSQAALEASAAKVGFKVSS